MLRALGDLPASLFCPRGPAPSPFPSSELKFGMKGFDHTLNPPTFWGDSWVPGRRLVPGTWSEPW